MQRYGGVPPYAETQAYVQRVAGYANEYRQQSTPTASTGASAALSASPLMTAALGVTTPTVAATSTPTASTGLNYSTH